MNSRIRPMTERDKAAVLDMMRVFYASPAVLSNGSDEIFARDFANCISDCPYLEGYIMEDTGGIRGYAMIAKSFSTEFGKPCIWIEDLYIREDSRGRGIGRQFLAFITEQYRGSVFRLEAEAENEGAVRLYRSFGFEVLPYLEMKK